MPDVGVAAVHVGVATADGGIAAAHADVAMQDVGVAVAHAHLQQSTTRTLRRYRAGLAAQ